MWWHFVDFIASPTLYVCVWQLYIYFPHAFGRTLWTITSCSAFLPMQDPPCDCCFEKLTPTAVSRKTESIFRFSLSSQGDCWREIGWTTLDESTLRRLNPSNAMWACAFLASIWGLLPQHVAVLQSCGRFLWTGISFRFNLPLGEWWWLLEILGSFSCSVLFVVDLVDGLKIYD